MSRGSEIHAAYAERILQERLEQHNVGRCAWCPSFVVEGTLAETRDALLAHRLEHHPEIQPGNVRKHKKRIVPMVTLAGGKTLDENIANAREQGAATWDGAA